MLPENAIEVRLAGDIKPESLSASDLGDLLKEVEKTLLPIVVRDNPTVAADEVFLSLVDIGHSSVGLRFTPSYHQYLIAALTVLTYSIVENSYSRLPSQSVQSLKEIADFSKKRNCAVEFRDRVGTQPPIAVITPDTEIPEVETVYLEGETTIYGKIFRVGGLDKPTVHIRLPENSTLVCNVKSDLAVELAHRLYSWVGLSGIARWRKEDRSIDHFRVEKITEYEDTEVSQAFNALSLTSSQYYIHVEDIVEYVNNIRNDREE